MKNAMKKLLSLMLVAVLLVCAVPFKASASEVEAINVPVKVYNTDGKLLNGNKTLAVTEEGIALNEGTAKLVINSWVNREYDHWESSTSSELKDGYVLTYEEAASVTLFVYVKETVPPTTTEPTTAPTTEPTTAPTTPATTEPTTAPTTPAATEPTTAPTTPPATEPADDNADLIIGNGDKKILLTLDMNYEGGKDRFVRVTDPNTKMGTIMEAIQKKNLIPTRTDYTFAGWYWDDDFDYKVKDNEYLADSNTTAVRIYARWTRNSSANNVYLKIYLNGTTSSPAKIVDISSYGDADGAIDIYEARKVVGNYYTAKDSAGLSYDGLFTDETWKRGAYNDSDEVNSVSVNADDDTFIYIMVYNAKTASSSSSSNSGSTNKPDTSNPKTGDSVYMVVTVMGLSAAAMAAAYYVSKKRAF